MAKNLDKAILEDILTSSMTREIWTLNCQEVLPFTPQDFDIGALLPAVLYMFRWGHRRGLGKFNETFATGQNRASVSDIATKLMGNADTFDGFKSDLGKDILADLLLCYCLDNRRKSEDRNEQVQRIFPTHYMASWIDLPKSIGHLRNVPEMLVALLTNQKKGDVIDKDSDSKSRFPVNSNFHENLLLDIFGHGMSIRASDADLAGDQFDESIPVGVDQLLSIRMAQHCGNAPQKLRARSQHKESMGRGKPEIPNQHPISREAVRAFSEDMRIFLASYGHSIPRRSLLPMLESCISLGITNVVFSAAQICLAWGQDGRIPNPQDQKPWPLFVDCSGSIDNELRRLSEQSMGDCMRRVARVPAIMMRIRLASYRIRYDRKFSQMNLPSSTPDATDWLNFVGDVVHERHEKADRVLDRLHEHCKLLQERLEEESPESSALDVLTDQQANPAQRLADAITLLMGSNLQESAFLKCIDKCMLSNEPNGMAHKRRVKLRSQRKYHKTADMKSVVLSNTLLDYLVHRHLQKSAKGGKTQARPLSFNQFLDVLESQYGLFVQHAPPGLSVSSEQLLKNRQILERRLRDLGLLVGVNDAESMKRLQPRFNNTEKDD